MVSVPAKEGKKYDAITIGLNVVDILFELPRKVEKDEKHEINRLVIQGGAPAGNAACGLASMGWDTAFIGKKGDNLLSTIAETELKNNGVSSELLIPADKHQPAVAVVEIDPDNGERTVFYSLNGYKKLSASDIDEKAISQSRLILVDGYEATGSIAALKYAFKHQIPSVLDIETGDKELMRSAMELGTHTILPMAGAKELTGCDSPELALKELSGWTEGIVLITDGIKGSWAINKEEILFQKVLNLKKAVDTTGCGDAYHAAYASALLDGLSLQLRMEFASFFASLVALEFGGRTNLPSKETLKNEDLTELSVELKKYIQG